jgi:hypothetical protein
MAERPNIYTAFVDPKYTKAERNRIGLEIVNFIVERTKQGKGIGGKSLGNKYSKSYISSPEFEIAGKSPKQVNLTLSGDMLDSVEVLDTDIIGRIRIGFVQTQENDKSIWLEEKGYDFLGLTDKELRGILTKFGPPTNEDKPIDIDDSLVESFVRGIFGR